MGKKGGSNTTVQSYQPTPEERRLTGQAADYSEAVAPNALWLNNVAKGLLQDSLGTIQVDYNQLNKDTQNRISNAQNGLDSLAGQTNDKLNGLADMNKNQLNATNGTLGQLQNGILPTAYLQNMSDAIKTGVDNTVGSNINDLGTRGVLNSSVTNKAMNDIENNVSNAMAQSYTNNINTVGGLANNQLSNTLNTTGANAGLFNQQNTNATNNYNDVIANATAGTTAAAANQEAAQNPATNLWNASLGLNGATTGALQAVSGKGTTTSTQRTSGGSGLFGGILSGLAGNAGLFARR